jgi:hypothetical protein
MIYSPQKGATMTRERKGNLPDTFWNNYRSVLARRSVSPKAAAWYVKRAKHFVWKRNLTQLQAVSAEAVAGYFNKALSRGTMEEWQIAQMVDAVRILCEEVLALAWAVEFEWKRWKQPHLQCPQVSAANAGSSVLPDASDASATAPFADAGEVAEVLRRWPEDFDRLRAEIRTRHYSIRTEEAYAAWLARFVTFRDYRSPDPLGAADVKAYGAWPQ